MLLCFSTVVVAQDGLSLFTRIESVTQRKEPKWNLEKKTIYDTLLSIQWSSDEGRVLVTLAITQSDEGSKAEYKKNVSEFEEGMDAKVSRTEWKALGDEGYLWIGYNDRGMSSVFFRKDRVVVHVFAPSSEVAKRFAQHVADQIPPSNKNEDSQAALTIDQALNKLNQLVGQWEMAYDILNWGKKRSDPIMPSSLLTTDDGAIDITIVRSDPTTISFSFSASVLYIAAAAKTTTESCKVKLKYDAQSKKYLLTITPSFGVAVADLPMTYSENVFSGTGRGFAVTRAKVTDKHSREANNPASASIILSKEGEHIWEIKAGQLLASHYRFAFTRKR